MHLATEVRSPFRLTEDEHRFLESNLGEHCASRASQSISWEGQEGRTDYCERYKDIFSALVSKAVLYKQKVFVKRSFEYLSSLGLEGDKSVEKWKKRLENGFSDASDEAAFLKFIYSFPYSPKRPRHDENLSVADEALEFCASDLEQDLEEQDPFSLSDEEYNMVSESFEEICDQLASEAVGEYPVDRLGESLQELLTVYLRAASGYKKERFIRRVESDLRGRRNKDAKWARSCLREIKEGGLPREKMEKLKEFCSTLPSSPDPGDPLEMDQYAKNYLRRSLWEDRADWDRSSEKEAFNVTEDEYAELDEAFGRLCHKAAWDAVRKYPAYDVYDVSQEIFIAMIRSGSQYKRKAYFSRAEQYLESLGLGDLPMVKTCLKRFNNHVLTPEEEHAFLLLMDCLPETGEKPSSKDPLILDKNASSYIKTCLWNQQRCWLKSTGKERSLRKGEVSLSEYDHWVSAETMVSEARPEAELERTRDALFERIKERLKDTDSRAARTYGILTDPKNEGQVFTKSGNYKFKMRPVRRETQQSYMSIKKDVEVIRSVMGEELERERELG